VKADYAYYDDFDVENIHTGENHQYETEPRKCGLIGGAIALLSTLAILGLIATIYHRDKNAVTMWHLIFACIAVVAALIILAVWFMTSSALKNRREPNHLLLAIGVLLAVFFFLFFLASALYMFMYRPFHYGNLIQTHNKPENWKYIFKDRSFNSGWGEDRKILWWIPLLGLLAALGFLMAAICLWSNTS
jgi:RsiW-degrading membrane proteinase PrsW (M82 family)